MATRSAVEAVKAVSAAPISVVRKAALRYHFAGGKILGELLVESDGFANGYLLDLGRGPIATSSRAEAEGIAKRFSPNGDRYVRSLRAGVPVLRVGKLDLARLTASTEGAASVVEVAKAEVEYGLWDESTREYFFKGGFAGRAELLRDAAGGMSLAMAGNLPRVLTPEATRKGLLPPAGYSGLPASLETAVPPQYRYWLAKGGDVALIRDALVSSEFFTADNVELVGGELRRVVKKVFLYEPPEHEVLLKRALPDVFAERVAKLLPSGVDQYFHPCLAEDWRAAVKKTDRAGAVFVFSPSDTTLTATSIAEVVPAMKGEWLVDVPDSPEARAALAKVGEPFKVAAPLADGHLFVASYPLPSTVGVEWVRAVEPVGASLQMKVAKAYMKKDEAGAQRLVLGVVLEPEVVDAQGDIYSELEIEQAAHKYMAEFQNRGYMHEQNVNDKVHLVESYIAPVDMAIGEQAVKKGTWMMVQLVTDDTLWSAVQKGALTGFSIGGSAVRVKEARAPTRKAGADGVAQPKTVDVGGIPILIDRPKGFVQTGKGADGKEWSRTYLVDYGFIAKTAGGDGEDLDVFLGPDSEADTAFWVIQKFDDGTFDEFKVFLGYGDASEVRKVYNAHIPAKLWGGVFSTPVSSMKALLGIEPTALAKAMWELGTDDVESTLAKLVQRDGDGQFAGGSSGGGAMNQPHLVAAGAAGKATRSADRSSKGAKDSKGHEKAAGKHDSAATANHAAAAVSPFKEHAAAFTARAERHTAAANLHRAKAKVS